MRAQMRIAGLGRDNRFAQSSLLQCRFLFEGSFLVDEGDFTFTAVQCEGCCTSLSCSHSDAEALVHLIKSASYRYDA